MLNPPSSDVVEAVVRAIQPERLNRYMAVANGDTGIALAYYVWNCSLSESFHLVLHFSEILCRNAFNNALTARAGHSWYLDPGLHALLDTRFRSELTAACLTAEGRYNGALTSHHIVPALNFGFWNHLATKRFERYLWIAGVQRVLPAAPPGTSRQDVHDCIESIRRWRNRVAHHRSIFDKGPMRKHGEALDLIGWVCPECRAWVASQSRVPKVLAERPKELPRQG